MQKKKRKMKKSTPKNPKAHPFVEKVELKKMKIKEMKIFGMQPLLCFLIYY